MSKQPASRLNGSRQRQLESCAKHEPYAGEGGGDDLQDSPLTRTLEIPYLIWELFSCYYLQYVPASKPLDHS